jgi:hypothetical protein
MIPHLQKCRCQSAHTKIRQTDPDHHIQTKYHIYNKHSKYKPLHTCNNIKSESEVRGMEVGENQILNLQTLKLC